MVAASVPLVVTSPERFPFVIADAPENAARLPLAGEPVVVTVPPPPVGAESVVPVMVRPGPSVISCGSPAPLSPRPRSREAADTFCCFA